jgi:hypothetical protein
MFELATPLRALVVGLAGVALAWLWFNGLWWFSVAVAVSVALLGYLLDLAGRSLLPKYPVAAVRLLESWILTPMAIAALGSAIVVVVTVALTIPDDSTLGTDAKELVGTLSTGLTAFVVSAFISWSGDDKDSKLADHVREVFQSKYARAGSAAKKPGVHAFRPESAGERWVFGDEYAAIQGWGRPARLARAAGVARELRQGTSEPV